MFTNSHMLYNCSQSVYSLPHNPLGTTIKCFTNTKCLFTSTNICLYNRVLNVHLHQCHFHVYDPYCAILTNILGAKFTYIFI